MRSTVIVGGGLVGSLLSIFLARRGWNVVVYERHADLRRGNGAGGRSINLVLTSRGIQAMNRVGLRERAMALTVPVTGRMIHSADEELAYQPYGKDESECNYSISRAELNRFLVTAAEQNGVTFQFEKPLLDVDFDRNRLTFGAATAGPPAPPVASQDPAGAPTETETIEAELLIGTDGAASVVRSRLMQVAGHTEQVDLLSHDYKELQIPIEQGRTIKTNVLHIWPRGTIMLMALPNLDGSFTVTLYMPERGPESFESVDTEARVRDLFRRRFPDAIPLIPDLERAFLDGPSGKLGTVRCHPWHHAGRVLLLGDAAHAIVPFFGQGMNSGFEDCEVVANLLDIHGDDDLATVFERIEEERKPNTEAIADMALENFVEMSESVGDERFLLRKKVEHRLEQTMPDRYRSRYSMVMYSSIPYQVAQEAGRVQQVILDELCKDLDDPQALDLDLARCLIRDRLTPCLARHGVTLDY